jgi:hypothetical protein
MKLEDLGGETGLSMAIKVKPIAVPTPIDVDTFGSFWTTVEQN